MGDFPEIKSQQNLVINVIREEEASFENPDQDYSY
jgi:hypothetical protein